MFPPEVKLLLQYGSTPVLLILCFYVAQIHADFKKIRLKQASSEAAFRKLEKVQITERAQANSWQTQVKKVDDKVDQATCNKNVTILNTQVCKIVEKVDGISSEIAYIKGELKILIKEIRLNGKT